MMKKLLLLLLLVPYALCAMDGEKTDEAKSKGSRGSRRKRVLIKSPRYTPTQSTSARLNDVRSKPATPRVNQLRADASSKQASPRDMLFLQEVKARGEDISKLAAAMERNAIAMERSALATERLALVQLVAQGHLSDDKKKIIQESLLKALLHNHVTSLDHEESLAFLCTMAEANSQ